VWLLGEIAARESPSEADTTAVRFREALALAEALRMRPLAAHCYASLGKIARRAGADVSAPAHLTTAMRMYGEMGMRFWLDRAAADT
jgi:hypothetical protein